MVKVVAISGYKPFELGIFNQKHPAITYIKLSIKNELRTLINEGLEWVLISGQLGVELWAAEVIYDLRTQENLDVKLAVITPFINQESSWNEQNKEWYESVLLEADYVNSVTNKPYEKPWQFQLKNQFLINKSDLLLLIYDLEKEGSPKFLYDTARNFQEKNQYEVKLIDFYDLQLLADEI